MLRSTRSAATAVLALFAATSCSTPEPTFEPLPTVLEVAHSAGAKLGGVAIGDVLPEFDGPEIVAVCVDGRVIVVHREDDRWRSEVAFQAPGELIQVAVGDLVPSYPGDEILAVGMAEGDEDSGGSGAVWLGTRHRDRGFEARKILEPSALQHAAVIGDLDASRDGLEALSGGFDMQLHLFAVDLGEGGAIEVEHRVVADDVGPAKGACALVEDGAALVACADGRAWVASSTGAEVVLEHTAGLARPAAVLRVRRFADQDGGLYEVAIASDAGELLHGTLTLDAFYGARAGTEVVHREGAKLRGAALGDFDAGRATPSLATSGYEGRISHLAWEEPDAWSTLLLADTGEALHHLAAGDVRPEIPGDELVAVGYAGEIYVLSR